MSGEKDSVMADAPPGVNRLSEQYGRPLSTPHIERASRYILYIYIYIYIYLEAGIFGQSTHSGRSRLLSIYGRQVKVCTHGLRGQLSRVLYF